MTLFVGKDQILSSGNHFGIGRETNVGDAQTQSEP